MNRLTNKNNQIFVPARSVNKKYFTQIFNKLSQLEDVEEDLRIELTEIFKALKEGIFFKRYERDEIHYSNDIESFCTMYKTKYKVCCNLQNLIIIEEDREDKNGWWEFKYVIWNLEYSDYGKTWAFTREALENGDQDKES